MAADVPTVGVLSPLVAGAFFGQLLEGIARRTYAEGGRVVAIQTLDASLGDAFPSTPPFELPVCRDRVDGYVVLINAVTDRYLEELRSEGKPVVLVSDRRPGFPCPKVLPDNATGVVDAVDHLVAHGHERIAFATNNRESWNTDFRERYEAYATTMRRHGLAIGPEPVFSAPNCMEEDGATVARELLARDIPCTAVVAVTDLMAAGMIRALQNAGVEIPHRLAVVGFDDRAFAAQLSPPLSTVRLDFASMGDKAAGLILEMIRGEPVRDGAHRVRAPFVARESCGCDRTVDCHLADVREPGTGPSLYALMAQALGGNNALADRGPALHTALRRLASAVDASLTQGHADRAALREASEALFQAWPRTDNMPALLEALQEHRRELSSANAPAEVVALADECERHIVLSLTRAHLRVLAQDNERLQASLHNEYFVSMALVGLRVGAVGLRSEEARPRSLEWLRSTKARRACLALWERREVNQQFHLAITANFRPSDPLATRPGTETTPQAFPPLDELYALGCPANEMVFVLPVKTATRDWGLLAVLAPAETAANTGRDIYFQWAALLGLALDHEALVESLERQSEHLAAAYEREQALAADVRASEERYSLASQAANDGLWDWDVVSGKVFFSPRWKEMLGYETGEVGEELSEWLSRVHADDRASLQAHLDPLRNGDRSSFECEHRIAIKDGSFRWALCRAVAVPGSGAAARRIVGSLTDINERKEPQGRLRHLAFYDALTGLPNRSLFMDRLRQALARAKRDKGYRFCLLFMDLDGFKAVNDRLGHAAGDLLLVAVAQRMAANLRGSDTAARFGGDEFAVLLEGAGGPRTINEIVRRLHSELAKPYLIEGQPVGVSATIGMAMGGSDYDGPEELVRHADAAMYRAKKAGPGSPPVRAHRTPVGAPGLTPTPTR